MRHVIAAAAFVLLCVQQARAADEAFYIDSAARMSQLFARTCLAFTGDVAGLRAALPARGMPRLSPEVSAFLLAGKAGIAFNATEVVGHMAVLSMDNGDCMVAAEKTRPSETFITFEIEMDLAFPGSRRISEQPLPSTPSGMGKAKVYAIPVAGQVRTVVLLCYDLSHRQLAPGRIYTRSMVVVSP